MLEIHKLRQEYNDFSINECHDCLEKFWKKAMKLYMMFDHYGIGFQTELDTKSNYLYTFKYSINITESKKLSVLLSYKFHGLDVESKSTANYIECIICDIASIILSLEPYLRKEYSTQVFELSQMLIEMIVEGEKNCSFHSFNSTNSFSNQLSSFSHAIDMKNKRNSKGRSFINKLQQFKNNHKERKKNRMLYYEAISDKFDKKLYVGSPHSNVKNLQNDVSNMIEYSNNIYDDNTEFDVFNALFDISPIEMSQIEQERLIVEAESLLDDKNPDNINSENNDNKVNSIKSNPNTKNVSKSLPRLNSEKSIELLGSVMNESGVVEIHAQNDVIHYNSPSSLSPNDDSLYLISSNTYNKQIDNHFYKNCQLEIDSIRINSTNYNVMHELARYTSEDESLSTENTTPIKEWVSNVENKCKNAFNREIKINKKIDTLKLKEQQLFNWEKEIDKRIHAHYDNIFTQMNKIEKKEIELEERTKELYKREENLKKKFQEIELKHTQYLEDNRNFCNFNNLINFYKIKVNELNEQNLFLTQQLNEFNKKKTLVDDIMYELKSKIKRVDLQESKLTLTSEDLDRRNWNLSFREKNLERMENQLDFKLTSLNNNS